MGCVRGRACARPPFFRPGGRGRPLKVDLESPVATPAVALLDAQIADASARLGRLAGDMTQAELEYAGPMGDRNTTASLLAHLAHVDLTWLCHLQGRERPTDIGPARDGVGRIPAVTGRTADELLARYGEGAGPRSTRSRPRSPTPTWGGCIPRGAAPRSARAGCFSASRTAFAILGYGRALGPA